MHAIFNKIDDKVNNYKKYFEDRNRRQGDHLSKSIVNSPGHLTPRNSKTMQAHMSNPQIYNTANSRLGSKRQNSYCDNANI